MEKCVRNLLTFNENLGIHTFNLPPEHTCPGRSSWCRKYCYGRRGNHLYQNVRKGQDARWSLTMDLDRFISEMLQEASQLPQKGHQSIRVHSCGDFYSIDYFRAWLEIAKNCPEVFFFTFTRTWRVSGWEELLLEAEEIRNFNVWWSTDPSTGLPSEAPRLAFVLDPKVGYYSSAMPAPNCSKQISKKKCRDCGLCLEKSSSTTVTFHKH